MKLNDRCFPQIVDSRDSENLYPIYIKQTKKIVVLASEPVGGRSWATELPCFLCFSILVYSSILGNSFYSFEFSTFNKITITYT